MLKLYAVVASLVITIHGWNQHAVFVEMPNIGSSQNQDMSKTIFTDASFHECSMKNACNFVVRDQRTGAYALYSQEKDIPDNQAGLQVFKKKRMFFIIILIASIANLLVFY